jgi:hypothetical protein
MPCDTRGVFLVKCSGAERLGVPVVSFACGELSVVLPPVLEDLELGRRDRLRVIDDEPLYELAAWRSG